MTRRRGGLDPVHFLAAWSSVRRHPALVAPARLAAADWRNVLAPCPVDTSRVKPPVFLRFYSWPAASGDDSFCCCAAHPFPAAWHLRAGCVTASTTPDHAPAGDRQVRLRPCRVPPPPSASSSWPSGSRPAAPRRAHRGPAQSRALCRSLPTARQVVPQRAGSCSWHLARHGTAIAEPRRRHLSRMIKPGQHAPHPDGDEDLFQPRACLMRESRNQQPSRAQWANTSSKRCRGSLSTSHCRGRTGGSIPGPGR